MVKHLPLLIDLAGITGAALIAGGIAAIYAPAGVISAGVMLLTGAIAFARKVSA